jgi:sugar lactone lactonase YvrE
MERSIVLFDIRDASLELVCDGIDRLVEGTIINDGVVFDDHLVFGCKDLKFCDKKAGLYLLRAGESVPVQLSDRQICSNGKAIAHDAHRGYILYDICSCSKQVMAWSLDIAGGKITDPRVVVDLTREPVFPDGMIMTPDGRSLIVAIYDPRDVPHGEARQYAIVDGQLERVWRCIASPRVTCPQLIERSGRIELLLTTATEGMPPELREKSVNAGCLFVAETDFTRLNDAPEYSIPA